MMSLNISQMKRKAATYMAMPKATKAIGMMTTTIVLLRRSTAMNHIGRPLSPARSSRKLVSFWPCCHDTLDTGAWLKFVNITSLSMDLASRVRL